jgi:hypothetical protein
MAILHGIDRFKASHVLQRAYTFDGTKQWANAEFFDSLQAAELYTIQMKPFWVDMLEHRIIKAEEL